MGRQINHHGEITSSYENLELNMKKFKKNLENFMKKTFRIKFRKKSLLSQIKHENTTKILERT